MTSHNPNTVFANQYKNNNKTITSSKVRSKQSPPPQQANNNKTNNRNSGVVSKQVSKISMQPRVSIPFEYSKEDTEAYREIEYEQQTMLGLQHRLLRALPL